MGFFTQHKRTSLPTLPQCGACGLYKGCKSPKMAPTGTGEHSILFVGEAPGETEDRLGEQFVGDAGQTLRGLLNGIVDIDECVKTNAAVCRPPKNEIEGIHYESCRPNVYNAIAKHKPRVIVLLGATAVKSVIGPEWKESIDELGPWVGWAIPSPMHKAWVCPTYHPSYILRQKDDKALYGITKEHLRSAVALEKTRPEWVDREALEAQVKVITNVAEAENALNSLSTATGLLSIDYETPALKPELSQYEPYSVALALQRGPCYSMLLNKALYPALSRVLRNPHLRKVGANIKYEERVTIAKLGHGVAGWFWDTVLSAHQLDNRPGITSLKFQSYVNLGVPDYSFFIEPYIKPDRRKGGNAPNTIRQADVRKLLLYGGCDALLTLMLALKQIQRASFPH